MNVELYYKKTSSSYDVLYLQPAYCDYISYPKSTFGGILNGETVDAVTQELYERIPSHGRTLQRMNYPYHTINSKTTYKYFSPITLHNNLAVGLSWKDNTVYYTVTGGKEYIPIYDQSKGSYTILDVGKSVIIGYSGSTLYMGNVYIDPATTLNNDHVTILWRSLPFTKTQYLGIWDRIGFGYNPAYDFSWFIFVKSSTTKTTGQIWKCINYNYNLSSAWTLWGSFSNFCSSTDADFGSYILGQDRWYDRFALFDVISGRVAVCQSQNNTQIHQLNYSGGNTDNAKIIILGNYIVVSFTEATSSKRWIIAYKTLSSSASTAYTYKFPGSVLNNSYWDMDAYNLDTNYLYFYAPISAANISDSSYFIRTSFPITATTPTFDTFATTSLHTNTTRGNFSGDDLIVHNLLPNASQSFWKPFICYNFQALLGGQGYGTAIFQEGFIFENSSTQKIGALYNNIYRSQCNNIRYTSDVKQAQIWEGGVGYNGLIYILIIGDGKTFLYLSYDGNLWVWKETLYTFQSAQYGLLCSLKYFGGKYYMLHKTYDNYSYNLVTYTVATQTRTYHAVSSAYDRSGVVDGTLALGSQYIIYIQNEYDYNTDTGSYRLHKLLLHTDAFTQGSSLKSYHGYALVSLPQNDYIYSIQQYLTNHTWRCVGYGGDDIASVVIASSEGAGTRALSYGVDWSEGYLLTSIGGFYDVTQIDYVPPINYIKNFNDRAFVHRYNFTNYNSQSFYYTTKYANVKTTSYVSFNINNWNRCGIYDAAFHLEASISNDAYYNMPLLYFPHLGQVWLPSNDCFYISSTTTDTSNILF